MVRVTFQKATVVVTAMVATETVGLVASTGTNTATATSTTTKTGGHPKTN